MITIQVGDLTPVTISNGLVWTIIAISIAVMLAFYVLRSLGIYTLAKRQGVKAPYLAFIPCVWMYTAVKLIKKVRLFNRPMESLALIFCIIFSVSQVLTFASEFIVNFPLVGNFLAGRDICLAENPSCLKDGYFAWTAGVYVGPDFVNPYGNAHRIMEIILTVISYVGIIFDLGAIFVTVFVYINLFRCYWPQHHVLASILSIFGLFAPFAFVIRNKDYVNYIDYMRSRYNYGPYGGPYNNPYGNPYNNPYNNPYGRNPYGAPPAPEHPFEEFAEKGEVDPGEPFKEFDDKNKD